MQTLEATCVVEIEKTAASFHAYAIPEGVEIQPGDCVLIHDAPTRVGYGETISQHCRITVSRAGPIGRSWTRAMSLFQLTELYEVGFEAGEPR